MLHCRFAAPSIFVLALSLIFLIAPLGAWTEARAGGAADSSEKAGKKKRRGDGEKQVRKARGKKRASGRRRRGRRSSFRGHAVRGDGLRAEPLPEASGDVWLWSENFKEEVRVNIYNDDGSFNDEALAALDHLFRCRRTREQRAVDPRLYEVLSIIQDHFNGERVTLVSGFRFQRNEGSRHYHASAMDIRIPGVSMRELYKVADSLDRGGMGIGRYPRSGFVHIDFRAPGAPSYRWTDRSGPSKGTSRGKKPSRHWKRRRNKPNT